MAFWHLIFTNCWNNSSQQSTTVSVVFTDIGNHAGEGLQQREDCKCWRTSPAHHGRVGTSWSAHYRRRSEGVAKTTASVCCCWRTVWTWTVTTGATVLLQLCIMTLPFNRLTAYNICHDCFQCSLTLSVACSVVKRYNAFCVKLTANSDTEQNNISKSTLAVCVSKHFHI